MFLRQVTCDFCDEYKVNCATGSERFLNQCCMIFAMSDFSTIHWRERKKGSLIEIVFNLQCWSSSNDRFYFCGQFIEQIFLDKFSCIFFFDEKTTGYSLYIFLFRETLIALP